MAWRALAEGESSLFYDENILIPPQNQIPFKEVVKVSFMLYPYNDLLPPIATEG